MPVLNRMYAAYAPEHRRIANGHRAGAARIARASAAERARRSRRTFVQLADLTMEVFGAEAFGVAR